MCYEKFIALRLGSWVSGLDFAVISIYSLHGNKLNECVTWTQACALSEFYVSDSLHWGRFIVERSSSALPMVLFPQNDLLFVG